MSKSMLHVQVHAACPSPCCMSKSMLHVQVHAACPSPCSMSKSMLHVHFHAAFIKTCCTVYMQHVHIVRTINNVVFPFSLSLLLFDCIVSQVLATFACLINTVPLRNKSVYSHISSFTLVSPTGSAIHLLNVCIITQRITSESINTERITS